MNKFSKKEALGAGWQTWRKNWKLLTLILVITWGLTAILNGAGSYFGDQGNSVPALIFGLAGSVLGLILSVGTIKIGLKLIGGEGAEIKDLFRFWKLVFKYALASLLSGLIVGPGLLLLIIPGIIWGIRLQFVGYFVVDKEMGPVEAVKASWAATRGSVINLGLFNLLTGLVALLGFLILGIGALVTVPVTMLATAWVYRKLAS